MDRDRFDALSRAFGGAVTRRAGIGAALAGALAVAAGTAPARAGRGTDTDTNSDANAAKKKKKKCKPVCAPGYACVKGTCLCTTEVVCGGTCCAEGQLCIGGACASCNVGFVPVGDESVNGALLQGAIDAAAPGATLQVPPGTYRNTFMVAKPLTLERCSADGEPLLLANSSMLPTMLVSGAGPVRLDGLAISTPPGLGSGAGGLLVSPGPGVATPPDVTVANCRIFGNRASGVYVNRASLTVEGETAISDNTANSGAGLFVLDATVTLQGETTVSGNVAEGDGNAFPGIGGGILLRPTGAAQSRVTLRENAAIVGNVARAFPGQAGGFPPAPGQGAGIAILNVENGVDGGTLDMSDARAAEVVVGNVAEGAAAPGADEGQVGGVYVLDPASPLVTLQGVTAARVTGNDPRDCSPGVCQGGAAATRAGRPRGQDAAPAGAGGGLARD